MTGFGHRRSGLGSRCRAVRNPFRSPNPTGYSPASGLIGTERAIMTAEQADYVLGHTSVEQQRLIRQARVLAPLTERFLRDAGISSGMRVLDIGCGMGDVTIIAAQLVGSAGRVTSIDLDRASN
jgi:SAM-dependent methyltransferase